MKRVMFIKLKKTRVGRNPLEKAEEIIQAANPRLEHASGDRAYYRLSTDSIHLPLKEQFPSAGDYYSTLLHELGYWTAPLAPNARASATKSGFRSTAP